MKTKTSPIWNYFVEINGLSAKCKICDKFYSRKGRTTTALKSHLKSLHIETFAEFEKMDEASKVALEAKKQEDSLATSPAQSIPTTSTNTPLKKKKSNDFKTELLLLAKAHLTTQESEYQVMAKYWTSKLERMERDQRILAEKFINDVLFEGECGNLNRNSVTMNADQINRCNISDPSHTVTDPVVSKIYTER